MVQMGKGNGVIMINLENTKEGNMVKIVRMGKCNMVNFDDKDSGNKVNMVTKGSACLLIWKKLQAELAAILSEIPLF